MLTPEDAVQLTVMQDQRKELQAQKEAAQRRHAWGREEELQAEIIELDADYESVLQVAMLI